MIDRLLAKLSNSVVQVRINFLFLGWNRKYTIAKYPTHSPTQNTTKNIKVNPFDWSVRFVSNNILTHPSYIILFFWNFIISCIVFCKFILMIYSTKKKTTNMINTSMPHRFSKIGLYDLAFFATVLLYFLILTVFCRSGNRTFWAPWFGFLFSNSSSKLIVFFNPSFFF